MIFENEYIKCKINIINDCKNIEIKGNILNKNLYNKVLLLASNPIDKRSSYSGTGLPFPSPDIAFENTKNIYEVINGNIDVVFTYPNSYYTVANKNKVISSLFLILENINGEKKFIRIELIDLYILRTLINRENRSGPEFYSNKYELLPVDTSEYIMIEYAKIKVSNNLA